MSVHAAVSAAERVQLGAPVADGIDPRWQALIAIGEYVVSDPRAG